MGDGPGCAGYKSRTVQGVPALDEGASVVSDRGQLPDPGWYDDFSGGYMRWWDGHRWTSRTKLIPGRSPVMTRPFPQSINGLEHAVHLILTVTTSGLWGLVWYYRAKNGRTPAPRRIGPRSNTKLIPVEVLCERCKGKGGRWEIHEVSRVWVECPITVRKFEEKAVDFPPPDPSNRIDV
ncbi:DUF2510 domain-containing protein [Actinoplanes xinjiangensis]|uniref:DUF2510 domain-containing protein n=1 Tax=Actinoplanes xinjiangensis TaxID=512350 RepID=UPI000D6A9D13|nr:hypothetical protein Axi01nite_68450 [Actinoplanes xinjiangensis]